MSATEIFLIIFAGVNIFLYFVLAILFLSHFASFYFVSIVIGIYSIVEQLLLKR